MKKKRVGKAKRLSMDIISTLPPTIIETILCLLPTKEAARTSILSREWRYKWTKIPNLEFSHYNWVITSARKKIDMRCTILDCIHQVLLSHQGQIHELTLQICDNCHRFKFDKMMLHLAKNHRVKKLDLCGWGTTPVFDFLISVFPLHHLTNLRLSYVKLEDHAIFDFLGSITSLVLDNVLISTQSLVHLLSNCPSLNSLSLHIYDTGHDENCTIVEIFKRLPMIEHLTIDSHAFVYWLDLGLVPQQLSSVLIHLKYFCLIRTWFDDGSCLPFLLVLIKCAPNLEKIKLEIVIYDDDDEYSIEWEKYSDVWLKNLIELEIEDLSNLKLEMELVKFILARSPKLKKLSIKVREYGDSEIEKSKMFEVLLQAPRASSVVRIIYV